MRLREGLSPILHNSSFKNKLYSTTPYRIGKVYGVIMNENTPTKEIFEKYGGWGALGAVLFRDYSNSKKVELENIDLNQCDIAYPMFPNQNALPLIGELILIFNSPSVQSQNNPYSSQNYYINIISLWNNIQHNAQSSNENSILGKTFFERADIRPLQPYEGDILYQGRDGNAIRLGGTAKDANRPNPWSKTGGENDPIMILGNGYNFSEKLEPYIEDINKDKSSIYLTSTQTIPLKVNSKPNPISKPIEVDKYNLGGQVLLSADRIVLSSKSDAILIYGNSNVGLYSNNFVTIDSSQGVIFNSPKIILGIKDDKVATEPILLGNKTTEILRKLISGLNTFSSQLISAVSTPQGTPLMEVNQAAVSLSEQLVSILKDIESIKSKTTFTN